MASEPTQIENTDLIDVSDIEPNFEDELDLADSEEIGAIPQTLDLPTAPFASLKERAAAFFIDATFLYIIYWLLLIVYRTVSYGEAQGGIPVLGINGIIFHGIYLLIALLWFVIPELAFKASPGKFLCRITVRKTDGNLAGFGAIVIRNVLRAVDIVAAPFIVTFAIMEWGRLTRRIGDVCAGTVVLKNLDAEPRRHALSVEMLASASGRALAFLIDLAIVAAIVLGFALMLTPEERLLSMLIVVLSPLAPFILYTTLEWLTKTSPGKWILGYRICHEDGTSLSLAGSVIRNIWRVFDENPAGFLVCLFSVKKQRPGDVAANTVVITFPRDLKGLIGLVSAIIIASGIIYGGILNRDSFLTSTFEMNFLPALDLKALPTEPAQQANLSIRNFTYAVGEAGYTRKAVTFKPGDKLFMIFEIIGYKKDGRRVWLEEDLLVRYPDDSVGLKLEKINEFNQEIEGSGPIRFENNIVIPEGAELGRYTITITVRDKLSRQELKEPRFFYVVSEDESPPTPEDTRAQGPPRPLPSPQDTSDGQNPQTETNFQ